MDLSQYDDDQLYSLSIEIQAEQERRANLAQIPGQVADLCRTYRDGGGDPAVLEQAVTGTE